MSRPLRIARNFIVVLVAIAGVQLARLAPSPIDPAPQSVPPAPALDGVFSPNTRLAAAELLGGERFHGPEDVAVDGEGRIYAGSKDGVIHRLWPDGTFEVFATTGGHPLGLAWAPDGTLIVCDAEKGLLSVDAGGAVTVLAFEAEGVPFKFTDDVDVARDGTIYFTDASARWGQPDYVLDLLESRPSGRLMKLVPGSGRVEVLLRDLPFANGVALAPDEQSVLFNETWAYRVRRYWLAGERAGQVDVVIENLPGFPDGISRSPRGTYWLALFTVRKPLIDFAHPYPWLKSLVARLPPSLRPKPKKHGFVVELDREGQVLQTLQDPGGTVVHTVTSVEEVGGFLYLGTLVDRRLARLQIAKGAP